MPSASNSKKIYCSNYPSSYPYVIGVSFEETYVNKNSNYSTISIDGYLSSDQISWSSNRNSYLKIYWHDNRTNKDTLVKTSTGFKSTSKGGKKTVSGTINVTHKGDGTLSGYAKLSFIAGSTSGGYSPSSDSVQTSNTALTKIPRASSISSLSGTYLGSPVTVGIDRELSTATHKVEYSFAGGSWVVADTDATTSCTFTPDLSLASNIPNATSGSLKVRVTTYNSGSTVGSSVTDSINLKLPDSVVPSIGNIKTERIDNGVPTTWGIYVKGYSKCKITIESSSGIYGSTIKSFSITGNNLSSIESEATTDILLTAGKVEFTCTVTDSRGRKASGKTTITVVDYSPPSISVIAKRCLSNGVEASDGKYLKVTVDYSIASVQSKNTVKTKEVSCNNVKNTTFSNGASFVLAANCSIGSEYVLTAKITDSLGNLAEVTYDVSTAWRIMNVKKNKKGVAFGKFSEKDNAMEFALNVYLEKNVFLDSDGENKPLPMSSSIDAVLKKDSNGNPGFEGLDGYLRTPQSGLLPYSPSASGYIGSSDNPFDQLYIKNIGVLNGFRFYSDWVGLYGEYSKASGNTERKGWIGHNGNKDMSVTNEYPKGYVHLNSTNNGGIKMTSGDDVLYFEGTGIGSSYVAFRPQGASTGNIYLGVSTARWKTVYSVNQLNASSDRNLKKNIESMDERYEKLFMDLKPVRYMFKMKTSDRYHTGFISQDIEESMNKYGINPIEFGGFCKDLDQDGNGYSYSLRYGEFVALNTHMIQKCLKLISDLQKELELLKKEE